MRRLRVLLVIMGTAVALAGCISPAAAYAQSPSAQAAAAAVPVVHLKFPAIGVFENDLNALADPRSYSDYAEFASATGTPIRIAMYYPAWGTPFDTAFAVQAARHGAVTDLMLQPTVSVASIAKGGQDTWLRSFAKEIKAFHDPVIISFGHEMNGCWYTWGQCETPPKTFVAGWRHIVTVFRQLKVRNVSWLWAPNGSPIKPLRSDYPGNSWVNIVSVTGYYAFAGTTFKSAFAPAISAIRKFSNKPVIIGEVGIAPGKRRNAQIANLFASAKADHVEGIVYFDVNQKHINAYKQDWRLERDRAALREFRLEAKIFLTR